MNKLLLAIIAVFIVSLLMFTAGCGEKPPQPEVVTSAPVTEPEVAEPEEVEEPETTDEDETTTDEEDSTEDEEQSDVAATVTLANRRVDNKILEIDVGDRVRWVNNEDALLHAIMIKGVHKFQGELKKLERGDTFEYTFEKEGEFIWQSSTNPLQQGRVFVGEIAE